MSHFGTIEHKRIPMYDGGNNGRVPMDDPEEKLPFTVGHPEGQIHIKEPKKPRGCFVGVCLCTALVLMLVALLAIVAVVVYLYLTTTCPCDKDLTPGIEALSDNISIIPPVVSNPTPLPAIPKSGLRLPRNIIPSSYTLDLRVDLIEFIFVGNIEIIVTCHEPTSYIILHVNMLNIDPGRISVIKNNLGNSELPIKRTFPVPENQFFVIEMERELQVGGYRLEIRGFQGYLLDDLRGLYKSTYTDRHGRTKYLAASQLQSVDARKVFPCFDEPDLKANFTVSITHQAEYISLSNMPLMSTVRLEGGVWMKDNFRTTPVMSTYLLAFLVADFSFESKILPDGLKISVFCQPDMDDQIQYALNFAGGVYSFFKEYFGVAEVVPKADHVAVPDFNSGAMENWGLVMYRETALLHDEQDSSISNKYWVSLIMAHEIAHSWFGNLVTMKWWDDLWLNEGFANTLMYFALDRVYPTWKVFDLQLVDNVYPVMTKDALLTSHAISTPIQDPDDIPQFFDSISYDKGMAVLRLLRGFLGWEDFQRGLQTYIHRYKFGNAEMTQLWETFSEVVGYRHNVSEIMDTWTRQMGLPVVTVAKIPGTFSYRVTQQRFLLNPDDQFKPEDSPYRYTWEIPFSYRVTNDVRNHTTWMKRTSGYNESGLEEDSETEIRRPAGACVVDYVDYMGFYKSNHCSEIRVPAGTWVLGNVDYMGFYRTNYDEEMWRMLIEQLYTDHKVFSTANRAGLISDAFNLARANLLDYKIALNLSVYLHREEEYVPWRAFLDSVHFLQGILATSSSYGMLQQYIYQLVAPQYRKAGTSDQGDLLERNLRRVLLSTAASVGVPDAIRWAQMQFNAWMEHGSKIPPDYTEVIFSVGVQNGDVKEWDYVYEKSQETTVASQAAIMTGALAFTQKPWLLWRFARWTLNSSKVRQQDVRYHFRYFSETPLGRAVALDFLLTNWGEFNTRFGNDAFLIRDVIQAITSLVNTDFEYNQLRTLYKERPPAGVASKEADNSLALIRSNIKWLNLNQRTISQWLENHLAKRAT